MTREQNSRKIIPLPLGNTKGEIEQGTIDRRLFAILKRRAVGRSLPTEFLTRSRRRREEGEVFRKTFGVRGDKIRALKEKIEAGNYRVEPKAVAEKLLEHVISAFAWSILPSHGGRCHQSHDQRRKPASL